MIRELKWTNKTPTKVGWYWKRDIRKVYNNKVDIVYIREYCGELSVMNCSIPTENTLWAGPIPEPKGFIGGEK